MIEYINGQKASLILIFFLFCFLQFASKWRMIVFPWKTTCWYHIDGLSSNDWAYLTVDLLFSCFQFPRTITIPFCVFLVFDLILINTKWSPKNNFSFDPAIKYFFHFNCQNNINFFISWLYRYRTCWEGYSDIHIFYNLIWPLLSYSSNPNNGLSLSYALYCLWNQTVKPKIN